MIWGGPEEIEKENFLAALLREKNCFSEAVPGKKKSRRKVPPAPPQIINGRPLSIFPYIYYGFVQ